MQLDINPIFTDLTDNKSRYLILYGGAGSGKSYFAAQKCLNRLVEEDDMRLLFCRKVGRTVRNSQYLQFKDIIRKHDAYHDFTFSDSRMEITCKANGNQLISAGLDDVEKLKSLTQPTSIWIEEATELTKTDFRQLDLRLRGIKHTYPQIMMTFNPISKSHWLYDLFFVRKKPETMMVKTTYHDNGHIEDDYKRMIERLQAEDPEYYKVYGLGEWGDNLEGRIYRYRLVDEMPDVEETIYGLDFGYNNPTALLKVGLKEREVFVQELLYAKHLTNADLAYRLQQLIPNKKANLYADSAEPQRIEELYRQGFNIRPAQKNVRDGIDFVKRYHLNILRGSTNLVNELDSYEWKSDLHGYTLDEPVKFNDHAVDALRYALFTHLGRLEGRIYGFV